MMKKLFYTLAILGMCQATYAQAPKQQLTPEQRLEKEVTRAKTELSLTDEQATKWKTAAEKRNQKLLPIRNKAKGSTTPDERKALRQETKSVLDAFNADVKTFLTSEQQTKWETVREAKKESMKSRRQSRKDSSAPQSDDLDVF